MSAPIISLLLFILLVPALAFPIAPGDHPITIIIPQIQKRQVGQGVTGNQTGNSGSTGGTGLGDGNGVGFAGTGNDIDTGDDFDIGDGNNTIGDGNSIEIGDRITNINLPLNMSDMIASGIKGGLSGNANGNMEININISMSIKSTDGARNATVSVNGEKGK
ncbi:hypothetical protein B0O99DRAFT_590516 [Bisporella sp. PMI_857]|nr:hypothetical protein B0O99DRAFT_590516 [Bisporella sp. PMI_857]